MPGRDDDDDDGGKSYIGMLNVKNRNQNKSEKRNAFSSLLASA
jgi:hypothetical protein